MPQTRKHDKRSRSGTPSTQNPDMVESVGVQSFKQKPIAKTININDKIFYIHPIYDNYGCSKDGYIINKKTLIPRKGNLQFNGYVTTAVYNFNIQKRYTAHRFIWEAVNQRIIPEDYQIHHINCNKQDNSIKNLELVTRQQNMIYEGNECKGKKIKSPQNVSIKCEVFHYHHIYTNFGANKHGQIFNKKTNRCSIGTLQSTGYMRKRLSQNGLQRKCIDVHRFVFECYNGDIPDKMQINHKDSNKQNNCINNLELVTQSENIKHAYKYKTLIEITTDKPIESMKLDIKMKESDDEFTDEEKLLINKKYKTLMTYIKNNQFPYKKQLQEHFPNTNFW